MNKKNTARFTFRTLGAALLLLAPLFFSATAWGQAGENLILNPKFRTADGQPILTSWSFAPVGVGSVVPAPDKPNENCLKLESGKSEEGIHAVQMIPLVPGKRYLLTYAVKVAAGQEYRAYVEWRTKEDGYGNTVAVADWQKGTGVWETKKVEFDDPVETHGSYVVLQLKNSGVVYFTDVSVVEVAVAK